MGPPVPPPHAAARYQSVSWVPVRPPIDAVSIATLCHGALYGLPLLLPGLRPVICHGPLYHPRLLMLLPGPECVMGPCNGLPLLLS
ncbi:unnamed protein product, partial [Staurois parvus]